MTTRSEKSRERTCIVTGKTLPEDGLLRFVVAPEGEIVPDLAARLPGRGFWVTADRKVLETAIASNAFARAAKSPVKPHLSLAVNVIALMEKRIVELLGLAKRAGLLVLGFSRIEALLANPPKSKRVIALIGASDGAEGGASKLMGMLKRAELTAPYIRLFPARQIGSGLGEELVVHAALLDGGLSRSVLYEIGRYRRLASDHAAAPESVIGAADLV